MSIGADVAAENRSQQTAAAQATAAPGNLQPWIDRKTRAEKGRRPYEMGWQLCHAFLQGRQWIGVIGDGSSRRLIDLPNPDDRERFTANMVTPYVWTMQGKVVLDDVKPDITFRRDDVESEAASRQHRRAFEYCWEEEAEGDAVYMDTSLKRFTYGIGALFVEPDPRYGKIIGEYPVGPDGVPITDLDKAYQYLSDLGEQGPAEFETFHEGRIRLRSLGPTNLYPPPGLEHERDFPWMIVGWPTPTSWLKDAYGKDIPEEAIKSFDTIGMRDLVTGAPGGQQAQVKEHAMMFRGYKLPDDEHPEGESMVWAGNTVLEHEDTLPHTVNGCGKIGLGFIKYHVIPGRFWPIGVVEPLIGPQRQLNRARSQSIEMTDRAGLGRVYAHKNVITEVNRPKGGVFELVEIQPGQEFPKETQGAGPGPWLPQEAQVNRDDMDRIAGVREVSLGNAPAGVSAYSAFALLAEQDDRRVGPVIKQDRLVLGEMAKVMCAAIKKYWPYEKQVALAGENGLMDVYLYKATTMPDTVYQRVGLGAPMPKSQAAMAQLIFDLYDRSISGGQPLPWDWLYDSLMGNKPQPRPKQNDMLAQDKARYENTLLIRGMMVEPAEYDNDELHVMMHRQAQEQLALVPGMEEGFQMLEQHIQMHLQNAQQKATLATAATGAQVATGGTNPGGFGAAGAAGAGGQTFGQRQLPLRDSNRLSPRAGTVDAGQRA